MFSTLQESLIRPMAGVLVERIIVMLDEAILRRGIAGHNGSLLQTHTLLAPSQFTYTLANTTMPIDHHGSLRYKSVFQTGAVHDSATFEPTTHAPFITQAQIFVDSDGADVYVSGSFQTIQHGQPNVLDNQIQTRTFPISTALRVATTLGGWARAELEPLVEEITTWLATAPTVDSETKEQTHA